MRKFIISDIHGFGNVYYSMMNYLDNISKEEEIELYINGDLIDRGYESAEILLDIKKRIENNNYKIVYLGGNHELMMHQIFEKRKKNIHVSYFNDWYKNGGYITDEGLGEKFNYNKDKIFEIADFVSNLKIYHKFEEKIGNKNIVLVHAACPKIIKGHCNMLIKEDDQNVFNAVWNRRFNPFLSVNESLGNKNYFTIIGHTPNSNKYGFEYEYKDNTLNIDGGCSCYVYGYFDYNHFPLVEVKDNYLKILTFNSNNEIIYGNYFIDNIIVPMRKTELEDDRKYLNKKIKMKKLAINEDGVVYYKK